MTELFAFVLVFCRMGSALMVMPGIGEMYVSGRARLLIAVTFSLLVVPIATPYMPEIPGSPFALGALIVAEVLIGLFIGLLSRMLISAMHTAGMLIATQSGLAAAMMFDMNAGAQGSAFGNLLSLIAVMLLFALNLHHVMLMGLADSYSLFGPGAWPPVADFAEMAGRITSSILVVAVAFSAPHLVLGLVIYLASGILSRLMPAMQIFFVIMPLQIMVSIFILITTLSAGMLMYMNYFETTLVGFLNPSS